MRLALVLAVAGLAALAPAAAGGGNGTGPPTFHDRGTDAGVDPDFCGTGQPVEFSVDFRATVWIGTTGGDPEQVIRQTFEFRATLTNPANGAAVIDHGAGQTTNVIVSGTEAGPHTHEFVDSGLRSFLKLEHGELLTRDAGYVRWRLSFDADDNVTDFEVLEVHGPHEDLTDGVWCDAAVEALGLA